MPYVRNHGNQLAIVHGEREPDSGKVQQRTLFTICSRPEALAVLDETTGWQLESLLRHRYPRIRFDWDRIRSGVRERMEALPETYSYREASVEKEFRRSLCTFNQQLGLTDPQWRLSAARLLNKHRCELEYLRDLIDVRLRLCDQEENEWNGDNAYFWLHRVQSQEVPVEVMETMSEAHGQGDLDRLESLARLFVESYENYADGHNYLGYAALDRNRPEDAIPHFERAMEVGRRLFPKRLARKHFWVDHSTRPYVRGMRHLVIALLRSGGYDEALETCSRLERECGDEDAATSFRASTFLGTGRWEEARTAAERLVGIWPEHAYLAAFASFELGDREQAAAWFLHGLLNRPRTGRMLLGLGSPKPKSADEALDHNGGVTMQADLHGFLSSQSRASRRFFCELQRTPTVENLLQEKAAAADRWRENRSSEDRSDFDRLRQMESLELSRETAPAVLFEAGRQGPSTVPINRSGTAGG